MTVAGSFRIVNDQSRPVHILDMMMLYLPLPLSLFDQLAILSLSLMGGGAAALLTYLECIIIIVVAVVTW